MLLRKNKGSILIMSLITFSIISLICMTCYSLVLSNNRINELEYKNEKLREANLGIIELMKSNLLEELNDMVKNTSTEDEFYALIKNNGYKDFIDKIKNIDNVDSEAIKMTYDEKPSNKQFIHYNIQVNSKINNYKKYSYIKLKIENPWFGINKDDNKENEKLETKNEEDKEEGNLEENSLENDKIEENIDDLITFHNYEEG